MSPDRLVVVGGTGRGGPHYTPRSPVSSDWPDLTNTGVPAGVSLTPFSGDYHTSADGEVIDALDISGSVIFDNANCILKRSKVRASLSNLVTPNAADCTVQDCEIYGNDTDGTGIIMRQNITVLRCYIHGSGNGASVEVDGGLIQDCYIYDLTPEPGPHTDGIQFDANATNWTCRHNWIEPIPAHVRAATSCLNVHTEALGTDNLTIDNNWIDGRGTGNPYYGPTAATGWTNIFFTNNFMLPGDNGYFYDGSGFHFTTYSNNVDAITGLPVAQDS